MTKHHVVVQYMAGWMKCPLPLPLPQPPPPARPPPPTGPPCGEDKEDKEESTTLLASKGLCTAVALSKASCFDSHNTCFCLLSMLSRSVTVEVCDDDVIIPSLI